MLAIGLEQQDAAALFPFAVTMRRAEHISSYFDAPVWNAPLEGVGPADVHNRAPRQLALVSAGARIEGDGVLARAEEGNVVFCQIAPWEFEGSQANLRRTYRRVSFLVSRLLGNMGVGGATPLLERFHEPVNTNAAPGEKRWLSGFYVDTPEEWDDPYRFFRW